MNPNKPPIQPAQVAMLVQGTEVYGIGTIERIYATHWPEMTVIALSRGPMWDWLVQRSGHVELVEGLASFNTRQPLSALGALPNRLRQARHDADRIHERVEGRGVRIIHTHWLPQQLIAGSMRRFGYRSVWQINNNSSPRRLFGMSPWLNHRLARWGADLLLPASDFIAANWRDSGVPTVTIRNAAEPLFDAASNPTTNGPMRCLVAGRLVHSKGHHVAVEAVSIAHRAGCNIELDIYGGPLDDNSYANDLRERIGAAGLSDRVRFMGFCTDLRQRHREYHLGLQCRVDPEPCSLWVCETLVDGLPILASATGGTPELVKDSATGYLYPSGSSEELAARLIELCRDRSRLAEMRRAAFDRGQCHFTVNRLLDQTLGAYARCF